LTLINLINGGQKKRTKINNLLLLPIDFVFVPNRHPFSPIPPLYLLLHFLWTSIPHQLGHIVTGKKVSFKVFCFLFDIFLVFYFFVVFVNAMMNVELLTYAFEC